MSIPPVPPANPDGPVPGDQPNPNYGQNPPQYGQNAPQYGQNAPQYGQSPYAQSPYSQYPAGQQKTADGVPKLVNIAFWLIVASGVVWLLSLLLSIGSLDTPAMRDMFEEQMAASGANVSFNDIKPVLVGTILVFAVISAGLYALVALNVRKGKNWARILGTVFAALSLLSLFPLSIGTLAVLAGVAGIVMLYLPTTSPYFRKQQPFANPYGQPGSPFGN
jgi:hypothetical protein